MKKKNSKKISRNKKRKLNFYERVLRRDGIDLDNDDCQKIVEKEWSNKKSCLNWFNRKLIDKYSEEIREYGIDVDDSYISDKIKKFCDDVSELWLWENFLVEK